MYAHTKQFVYHFAEGVCFGSLQGPPRFLLPVALKIPGDAPDCDVHYCTRQVFMCDILINAEIT